MKNFFAITIITAIILLPAISFPGDRPSPDEYWRQIRKIAKSEFSGMDIEVAVNTSYQFKGENEGPMVGFTMPLYSKKDRMARRGEATHFLQRGAELIKKLEASMSQAAIMREACKYMKARIDEEGVQAATAYFETISKIALHDAEVTQFHREIKSLIAPFSGKATIYTDQEDLTKTKL